MSLSYGITGIGNGLGTLGLGGTSSYYDPTMMGMAGAYSPYGSMGMMGAMGSMGSYSPYSGMGMMGMYNPSFMGQMNKAYQQMEVDQLNHAGAMHNLMLQNKTKAYTDQDRAIFEKAMVDTGVYKGVKNLAEMVRKGNSDGICQAYDELKQTLYTKYSDYFKANANHLNPEDSVANYIERLYSEIITAEQGEQVDLRSDVKKYGETAFEHGFWKNFHGSDYHDKTSEQALSYMFGTPIDNKAGHERMEKYGATAEKIAEVGAAATVGAVAAPTAVTIVKNVLSSLCPSTEKTQGLIKRISDGGKKLSEYSAFNKKWAWAGAIGLAIGDWLWQQSRA